MRRMWEGQRKGGGGGRAGQGRAQESRELCFKSLVSPSERENNYISLNVGRSAPRRSHSTPTPSPLPEMCGSLWWYAYPCQPGSLQPCSQQPKGQPSHVAASLCEWVQAQGSKSPPMLSALQSCCQEWHPGNTMEMGRPQGTGPRLSGRAEQRASSQWKELRQREKGAGWEWWRAKERKATCHPGRFQGGWEEVVEEALAGNKCPDMALPV